MGWVLNTLRLWLWLLFVALCGGGCVGFGDLKRDAFVVDTKGNRWSDVAVVEFNNTDTVSLRDISIFVKHQPYERLDSIAVTIYTVAPDEVIQKEPLTLRIEGCRRRVSVLSHIHNVPYRRDVVLRQEGIYRLYIFPSTPIQGIEAVGVMID